MIFFLGKFDKSGENLVNLMEYLVNLKDKFINPLPPPYMLPPPNAPSHPMRGGRVWVPPIKYLCALQWALPLCPTLCPFMYIFIKFC